MPIAPAIWVQCYIVAVVAFLLTIAISDRETGFLHRFLEGIFYICAGIGTILFLGHVADVALFDGALGL